MFSAAEFFSLQQFLHSNLWRQEGFVWEGLSSLENFFQKQTFKIESKLPRNVFLENEKQISIGVGVVIEPGVFIQGPCIIGSHCHLRHGAFLRGLVVLGDHCVVGHGSEVKRSIFMNRAAAAHLCYVGDSILGSDVNLGAGVKCSNVRLDGRKISVHHDGVKTETNLRKLGAIVGDGAQIGCNCVLNPGTLIGKKSLVHPLLNVGGVIPAHVQVRAQRNWVVQPIAEKILEKLLK